jgi:hypothetical protein
MRRIGFHSLPNKVCERCQSVVETIFGLCPTRHRISGRLSQPHHVFATAQQCRLKSFLTVALNHGY